MKIIESISEMREYSQQLKCQGKTIACVTTEGDLHDGHMSLVKIAEENVDVVVKCFQSPIPKTLKYAENWPKNYKNYLIEEEARYQKQFLKTDLEICRKHKVDVFFHPSMLDLYPYPVQTITISHKILNNLNTAPAASISWCLDVNIKIWNSVLPDIIIEGQKDIHQTLLMKAFINYFHFPIKIIVAPTIRNSDGMALSSRNRYLSDSERQDATSIYQVLHEISRWSTYPSIAEIKEHITNRINQTNGYLYYIDICCAKTLEELDVIDKETVIVVVARFGEVDVWDNIIIEP
jgi:pantoate--beta-alanine ligase